MGGANFTVEPTPLQKGQNRRSAGKRSASPALGSDGAGLRASPHQYQRVYIGGAEASGVPRPNLCHRQIYPIEESANYF